MNQVTPNPEILLCTRKKNSPFFYASRRHGVAMYSVVSSHYGDSVEEYWQLSNGVTLWDVGGA